MTRRSSTHLVAALLAASLLSTGLLSTGPALAETKVPADLTQMPPPSNSYKPKKTSWGDPDFRGNWPINDIAELPVERPEKFGNRQWMTDEEVAQASARAQQLQTAYKQEEQQDTIGRGHWIEYLSESRRTGMLVDPANGQLPELTDEGKWRASHMRSSWVAGQTYDWLADFDSWDRCITRGLPASMMPMMYNNGLRIFQAPGVVAIQMEMIHETRIIPTDGRPGIPAQVGNWLGESRGHWEGANTLVIETTNFRPGASATSIVTSGSPPWNDSPISAGAKLVERLTMTGPDAIVYETLWTDLAIFTEPFGARLDWKRNDGYEFFEYACHEGNVQLRNYINASRAQRAGKVLPVEPAAAR